jgi:hypothetical protein
VLRVYMDLIMRERIFWFMWFPGVICFSGYSVERSTQQHHCWGFSGFR